ncbi:MAG: PAC2 family protein [Candidatus Anstonellales archaeon]
MEMFVEHSKIRKRVNRVIAGYPGVGLIGIIVAEYIAKNSKANLIGEVISSSFKPARAIMLEEGIVNIASTKLFYLEHASTIIMYGESQPMNPYTYSTYMLNLLAKKYKVQEIIGIGGYSDPNGQEDEIYIYANNKQILERYRDFAKPGPASGNVFGVLAVLPTISQFANIDGLIVLKTTKITDGPDIPAAKSVIKRLDEFFKLGIDYTEIDRMISDIDRIRAQMIEEFQKSENEATKQYIR